jgi:hypothetical protein
MFYPTKLPLFSVLTTVTLRSYSQVFEQGIVRCAHVICSLTLAENVRLSAHVRSLLAQTSFARFARGQVLADARVRYGQVLAALIEMFASLT